MPGPTPRTTAAAGTLATPVVRPGTVALRQCCTPRRSAAGAACSTANTPPTPANTQAHWGATLQESDDQERPGGDGSGRAEGAAGPDEQAQGRAGPAGTEQFGDEAVERRGQAAGGHLHEGQRHKSDEALPPEADGPQVPRRHEGQGHELELRQHPAEHGPQEPAHDGGRGRSPWRPRRRVVSLRHRRGPAGCPSADSAIQSDRGDEFAFGCTRSCAVGRHLLARAGWGLRSGRLDPQQAARVGAVATQVILVWQGRPPYSRHRLPGRQVPSGRDLPRPQPGRRCHGRRHRRLRRRRRTGGADLGACGGLRLRGGGRRRDGTDPARRLRVRPLPHRRRRVPMAPRRRHRAVGDR